MGLHLENKRQLQINREELWAQEFNEKKNPCNFSFVALLNKCEQTSYLKEGIHS